MARFGLLYSRALSREAEATGFHRLWDPAAGGSITNTACFHQMIFGGVLPAVAGPSAVLAGDPLSLPPQVGPAQEQGAEEGAEAEPHQQVHHQPRLLLRVRLLLQHRRRGRDRGGPQDTRFAGRDALLGVLPADRAAVDAVFQELVVVEAGFPVAVHGLAQSRTPPHGGAPAHEAAGDALADERVPVLLIRAVVHGIPPGTRPIHGSHGV